MYRRNFALTLEEMEVQTEPNRMNAFELLAFFGGHACNRIFDP
jgi:hypothetical protein